MRANRALIASQTTRRICAARPGPSRDKKRLAQDDKYISLTFKVEGFE